MARSDGNRKLKTELTGDASSLQKAYKTGEDSTQSFGKKMTGMAKGVGGALAVGFAVDRVVDFGAELIGLGNQSDAWRKKAKTVFEGQADQMAKWADANAGALGITGDNLLGLSANFADLLKPMGFTADQAAEMSRETLDLSGALSAWSGGTRDAAEVSEILSKAMLGEREGLKGLGISISEAEIQSRLLEKGQKDLTGEALAQAKALATQELIMEKSTDAQAAWADGTQDNVKKQAELSAKFAEVKETLGEKLLPVFNTVVGVIADKIIPGVEKLIAIFSEDGLGGVVSAVGDSLRAAWPQVQQTLADMGASLWQWIQESGPEVLRAIGRVWLDLEIWLYTVALPAIAKALGEMTVALWQWIQEAAPPALRALGEMLGDLWDWIIDEGLPLLWETTQELASALWEWIKDVTPPALRALGRMLADLGRWIIGTALPTLHRLLQSWVGAFLGWIADAVRALPGKLLELLSAIGGWIVFEAAPAIARLAGTWRNAVLDWVTDAVKAMPGRLWSLGNAILGWVGSLPGRIASAARGMFDGITEALKSAGRAVIAAWNSIDIGFSIRIPSWVPGIGGKGWTVSDLIPDVGVPGILASYTSGYNRPGNTRGRFHSGGTYRAPMPGGEGLALLRDGERITPAGEGRDHGNPQIVQLVVDGRVLSQAIIDDSRRNGGLPIKVRATAVGA